MDLHKVEFLLYLRDFYYALGQRIAFRNSKIVDGTPISNQLYYALNDHLGSLRVALDSQGEVVWQGNYDAFGVVHGSAPTHLTTRLYTNQRYEPAVRLYHYGSRFYDPGIGQFIQPDSIIPDSMNPLAWNRYAYGYQVCQSEYQRTANSVNCRLKGE